MTEKIEDQILKGTDLSKVDIKTAKSKKVEKPIVLKNILGKDMDPVDYFYKGVTPVGFNSTCGMPVDRDDLKEVFNKVFNVKDNILFYKTFDKEVYIVIIPLKYSSSVGADHESIDGDFQKHAISFLNEGSVNTDTLKMKLKKIVPFIKFTDR